jgi:hypothetical protein
MPSRTLVLNIAVGGIDLDQPMPVRCPCDRNRDLTVLAFDRDQCAVGLRDGYFNKLLRESDAYIGTFCTFCGD